MVIQNVRLFSIACLGCKVNQAEVGWLTSQFIRHGWREILSYELAELIIIMTCSVTAKAANQSRRIVRRLGKLYFNTQLIVTGCDVQAFPLEYNHSNIIILSRKELINLPNILTNIDRYSYKSTFISVSDPIMNTEQFCPGIRFPSEKYSRGLLKIQDGCNINCAYCIVPTIRGRSYSLSLKQICEAWRKLAITGVSEVVLTGVNLGCWGIDLIQQFYLTDLLSILLRLYSKSFLRLSSLEFSDITYGLLQFIADELRICPHLHVPLQTGSDRLLKCLGRLYTADQYAQMFFTAQGVIPNLCFGADVIVGLPGETEEDFKNTYDLISYLPFSYLHIFPYSVRPGSLINSMPISLVPSDLVKARVAELRILSKKKRLIFYQSQIGRLLFAVMENRGFARTVNYCLVYLGLEENLLEGSQVEVKILGIHYIDNKIVLKGKII